MAKTMGPVLITSREWAEVFGVSPETLKQWRKRNKKTFPQPVAYGEKGPRRDSPNWDWDQVLAWMTGYKPRLVVGRNIQFPAQVEED